MGGADTFTLTCCDQRLHLSPRFEGATQVIFANARLHIHGSGRGRAAPCHSLIQLPHEPDFTQNYPMKLLGKRMVAGRVCATRSPVAMRGLSRENKSRSASL
jgi:hypothetical protein